MMKTINTDYKQRTSEIKAKLFKTGNRDVALLTQQRVVAHVVKGIKELSLVVK